MLTGPLLGLLYALLLLDYGDPSLLLGLHSCYLGFLDPLHCLLAPWPFSLIGHLQPNFNSAFTLVFTNYCGLFWPSYHTLYLWSSWVSINPLLTYFITLALLWPILIFLHHIMLTGLLLFSLGSFRPICFSQDPFIYFMGL